MLCLGNYALKANFIISAGGKPSISSIVISFLGTSIFVLFSEAYLYLKAKLIQSKPFTHTLHIIHTIKTNKLSQYVTFCQWQGVACQVL